MQSVRRTDVDEMTVLAGVLGVTPADLLAEPGASAVQHPDHPAIQAAMTLAGHIKQLLGSAGDPEEAETLSGYVNRALRRLQVEAEELLAETPGPDIRKQE